MEVSVNVSLNGIEEKLQELGPKLAKRGLRKALTVASKIVEDSAKSKTPVDSGALKKSIGTKVTMSSKLDKGTASVGPMMGTDGVKKDSSQDPGVYGMFVELGIGNCQTKGPQPFLRGAFDNNVEKVINKFVESLKETLDEVVK